ncbi:hypothetical protein GCM10010406_01400 [Streptomyces thermolineatus]|uniref:Antitoxin VbhA domain-containing protein n=1 Tax=Streptomyces thermolineatus TaxID=44033 RepID=A0ABN3KVA7_9ACTN
MHSPAPRSRVERGRQAGCARACIEESFLTGAALSEEEMVRARGMLAANKARTAARRTDGTSTV